MEPIPDNDGQLARRVCAGDDAAFDELMRRYRKPVLNFVYRMIGDAVEAEDIAQNVFVRAYRNMGRYRDEMKFSTWLFALARHAAIDHLRYRQRRPVEPMVEGVTDAMVPGEVEVENQELGALIAAAVAKLPEEQRAAFILSEYHGLKDDEIAGIMECSRKSVESRLYRAKQMLRDRLAHLLGR
jgi:RNA polymerase sigma-70 factor (ECF subfamily)